MKLPDTSNGSDIEIGKKTKMSLGNVAKVITVIFFFVSGWFGNLMIQQSHYAAEDKRFDKIESMLADYRKDAMTKDLFRNWIGDAQEQNRPANASVVWPTLDFTMRHWKE